MSNPTFRTVIRQVVRTQLRLLHDGIAGLVQGLPDQRPRGGEERSEGRFGSGAHTGCVQVWTVVAVVAVLQLVEQIFDLVRVNIVHLGAFLGAALDSSSQIFRLGHLEPPQQRYELLLDVPLSGCRVGET